MVELWFAIVALSFTAYVVLDGFDLGAGAVMTVARGESYFSPALHPLLLSGYLAQQSRSARA